MKRALIAGVLALAALAGMNTRASAHGCYGCGCKPVYCGPVCVTVTFTLNIGPAGEYVPMVPNGFGH